jgi:hypothetical protein
MKLSLDPDKMISDFSFKAGLPLGQARRSMVEDIIISFIRNRPSTNHEDFHEEEPLKLPLGNLDSVMNIRVIYPQNAQSKPMRDSRGAVKDSKVSSTPQRQRGQL